MLSLKRVAGKQDNMKKKLVLSIKTPILNNVNDGQDFRKVATIMEDQLKRSDHPQ